MYKLPEGIRRTINWSYERGSWQYDLLCLVIIAVIFLVPSRYFGDRDRPVPTGIAGQLPPGATEVPVIEVGVEQVNALLRARARSEVIGFPVEGLGCYLAEQYYRPGRSLRYEQLGGSPQL
ncbi:MAG: hypothetical protein ACK562_14875, partial [Acidobacteriota bacterium]